MKFMYTILTLACLLGFPVWAVIWWRGDCAAHPDKDGKAVELSPTKIVILFLIFAAIVAVPYLLGALLPFGWLKLILAAIIMGAVGALAVYLTAHNVAVWPLALILQTPIGFLTVMSLRNTGVDFVVSIVTSLVIMVATVVLSLLLKDSAKAAKKTKKAKREDDTPADAPTSSGDDDSADDTDESDPVPADDEADAIYRMFTHPEDDNPPPAPADDGSSKNRKTRKKTKKVKKNDTRADPDHRRKVDVAMIILIIVVVAFIAALAWLIPTQIVPAIKDTTSAVKAVTP